MEEQEPKPNTIQVWVNDFKPQTGRNIEEIDLPEELTCGICGDVFPRDHFAKAQLNLLRVKIDKEGLRVLLTKYPVKCETCSLKSNTERKCRMCHKWKGIYLYARVQRNLDSPLCMRCQDWIQQEEWREANPPLKPLAALEDRSESVDSEPAKGESQPAHAHASTDVGFYVRGSESASEDEDQDEEVPVMETTDFL